MSEELVEAIDTIPARRRALLDLLDQVARLQDVARTVKRLPVGLLRSDPAGPWVIRALESLDPDDLELPPVMVESEHE